MLSRAVTNFGNKFCLKRRSTLIKALDDRLYVRFMQLEMGLFAAKLLRKDLRKLAKWCAKWRIKLNPEKAKVRSSLARNSEPILKLYGERLKIYPQVKFLGITFDSKFTFQKHFEEILGRCNQVSPNQTFSQQKMGTQLVHHITNL